MVKKFSSVWRVGAWGHPVPGADPVRAPRRRGGGLFSRLLWFGVLSLFVSTVFLAAPGLMGNAHGGFIPDYCSPAANVMLVVDRSGSMEGIKWDQAKQAIRAIIERHPTAYYGLVLFSGFGELIEELAEDNEADIVNSLNLAAPGGDTNVGDGFIKATAELELKLTQAPFNELQSIVIIITDGEPNEGQCQSEACLTALLAKALFPGLNVNGQLHSVLTFVIGFGTDVDPMILSAMARAGGTTDYAHANNLGELQNALETVMSSISSPEVCDGYDNDCDGVIDNGVNPDLNNLTPADYCSTGLPGICSAGYRWCENGAWICIPFNQPQPEQCTGMDLDCDGFVDGTDLNGDGILQPEESLRNRCGECGPLPVEECNGLDDDCNGLIDDGAVCPDGLQCIHGRCTGPCASGECPAGFTCRDELCVPPCAGVECGDGQVCDEVSGSCFNPCDGLNCPGDKCVNGQCGTCYEIDCPDGQLCVYPGECRVNPCNKKSCKFHEHCQVDDDGEAVCVPSCATVACSDDEICQEGVCVKDGCELMGCLPGQLCPNDICVDDPCKSTFCEKGQMCVPKFLPHGDVDSSCVPDMCSTTVCRTGQVCKTECVSGHCFSTCIYQATADLPDEPYLPLPGPGGDGDQGGGDSGGGDRRPPQREDGVGDSESGEGEEEDLGCSCTIGGRVNLFRGGRSGGGAGATGSTLLLLALFGLGLAPGSPVRRLFSGGSGENRRGGW